ncbi:MAG: alpha/beta fold hydrolase [Bacteroidota bacterium]
MKRTILLFFILLFTTSAFSQGILNMIGRSEEFFKLLSSEKFTEAYATFDAGFQAKVTEDNVKQIWTKLSEKLGKLESIQVTSSKTQGEFFTVTLEGKFTNDSQNFLLAFDKSEKIVGFFLQPNTKVAAYIPPAYADTSLYREKEIYIKTLKHSLVGILTAPKKGTNYPIVVLVHGSGPQDMDESFGPNKPLKDLAVGLASKGIASIRYVKRTMVYAQEFGKAFTVKEEVMDDALAAIALARTVVSANKTQIYLLGHSLGGMMAPKLATLAPDVKGIVLLAAPARKLTDLIAEQSKFMFSLEKDTTKLAKLQLDSAVKDLERSRITKLGTLKADSILFGLPAAYWVDLNLYNQVSTAKKLLKQRIFVAQGTHDFQVSTTDYNLWKSALAANKKAVFKLYPELNHMMMVQKDKGDLKQYQVPGNVSATVINDVAMWIKAK